jgi:hypothetical protein
MSEKMLNKLMRLIATAKHDHNWGEVIQAHAEIKADIDLCSAVDTAEKRKNMYRAKMALALRLANEEWGFSESSHGFAMLEGHCESWDNAETPHQRYEAYTSLNNICEALKGRHWSCYHREEYQNVEEEE